MNDDKYYKSYRLLVKVTRINDIIISKIKYNPGSIPL